MAGVKEKLLDDEDHEPLMDPSIIKQHSKFIVKFMRSYFEQGFGSGSGSARIRMFLPCPDPDPDPHKFADPDPDPGKKVRK